MPEHASLHEALRLGALLAADIEADGIAIALQPRLELQAGRVLAYQVFARWQPSASLPVRPEVFIAMAQRMALAASLNLRVLDKALQILQAWQRGAAAMRPLSVRLSAAGLLLPDLAQRVAQLLQARGLGAQWLELQVAAADIASDAGRQSLAGLRRLGVGLCLCRLGAAYPSVVHVRDANVHALLFDHHLVRLLPHDAALREIGRMTVDVAARARLRCIASHIETRAQLAAVQALGIREGCGYLFGAPLVCGPEAIAPGAAPAGGP